MRPLAEFLMQGRIQAFAVATLALFIPMFYWIAAAIVALVTLRKGTKEGGALLMWCTLPAIAALLYRGEIMPLVCLPGAFIGASMLRSTLSWPKALIGISVSGVIVAILLSTAGEHIMTELVNQTKVFFEAFSKQISQAKPNGQQTKLLSVVSKLITVPFVAGFFGSVATLFCTFSLMLARWWQAILYNPGGFGKEFKQIRFSPTQAMGLLLAIGCCMALPATYSMWASMFGLPLLFAGISLVHSIVYSKQMGEFWLYLFYGLLLLVDPFKLVIAIIAVLDSWFNFRGRLPQPPENKPEP